jgi:hypothetical protein
MRRRAIASCAAGPATRRQLIAEAGHSFPVVLAWAAATASTVDAHAWRRWWRQWQRSGQSILDAETPLDGREVAALLGVEGGPALGAALKALRLAVVRNEVRSPAGARRWLRSYSG